MALTVVNLTDTFDEWRVKTNTLGTNTGDLTTLSTTAKGTLVAAINELDGEGHIANVVEDTCQWDAPVPYPTDEEAYDWDEDIVNWVLSE